jgi:predicted translin family RNA/ssDNA-binding protein
MAIRPYHFMTTSFFSVLEKTYHAQAKARGEVIRTSSQALNISKRAIFALHRGDAPQAEALLKEASDHFAECEKIFKTFPALKEGAYTAALEEYAEALLFRQYVEKKSLGKIEKRAMTTEVYLGGLSDATGEIVRYATRQAISGNTKEVEKAEQVVSQVVENLLRLDLTGYLRQKFDQAKKNLRQLEQILYDLRLRG